jgi:hypothetical protein
VRRRHETAVPSAAPFAKKKSRPAEKAHTGHGARSQRAWDRCDDRRGGQEPRIIGPLLSGHTASASGLAVDPIFPMVNAF